MRLGPILWGIIEVRATVALGDRQWGRRKAVGPNMAPSPAERRSLSPIVGRTINAPCHKCYPAVPTVPTAS